MKKSTTATPKVMNRWTTTRWDEIKKMAVHLSLPPSLSTPHLSLKERILALRAMHNALAKKLMFKKSVDPSLKHSFQCCERRRRRG